MKTLASALTLLFALLMPLMADFDAGLKAYNRGDYATALKEWQPLAEKGDANAEYNIGLLYATGHGVQQDYKQAAGWYRKAADQGVAAAQFNLGVIYANGQGVAADPVQARKWFSKAARHGVAAADTGLADLYSEGHGFQDYAEARKWYLRAAQRGIASAEFSLGVMCDIGEGVPSDYQEAIKWYRKAADQGYAAAMTNLGILYYNAQGVTRDLVQAYAWFSRAAEAGDPRAGELLRTTGERMQPKDLAKAREVAAEWQPANRTQAEANRIDESKLFAPRPNAAPAVANAAPAVAHIAEPVLQVSKPQATQVQDVWSGVGRVVAVGDIHGDFEQFVLVLESAGLIDGNGNWVGGKTHLVQTGNIVDRGPDSRKIMDLLMRLQPQAAAAGGGVHVLIGNHEAMNIYGDLRFTSPGEFAAFREDSSATESISYNQDRQALTSPATPDTNPDHWLTARPPGFAAHRAAFSPQGTYGKWIDGHNTVIKIDDTLFVNAGISSKYVGWSLDEINQRVRDELHNLQGLHGGIVTDKQGPLWYRGLAAGDPKNMEPLVDAILENYGVKRIVIGHSYADAAITPRFGGKVILIDIGLSRIYDNIGKLACLLIENGTPYALHRGQKITLPRDSGPDMLRYLKECAALDPQPSPLLPRIAALETKLSAAAAGPGR
jgi:TPR repeat protein